MKFAIRVDGSRAIGTGHVRRMISLAKAIRAMGVEVVFVWRRFDLDHAPAFTRAGCASLELPPPTAPFSPKPGDPPHAEWAGVNALDDAADTIAALAGHEITGVIIDHYAFDALWHRVVREALGVQVAAVDDLADRALDVDLLIDHNLSPEGKYHHHVAPGTRTLISPRFALLDPAYADAPRYAFSDQVRTIGIFMGGADLVNATARVLDAISAAGFDGKIEAVVTSANPHLAELAARTSADPRITLTTDLPDLASFFARHDLQIGAGGGATWERCCIGAPTMAITVAANQHAALRPLADIGAVAMCASLEPAAVAAGLKSLLDDPARRRALSDHSLGLVDGRGTLRVAAALMRDTIAVRPATSADAERMFAWRNDPAVRDVSRDSRPFGWEDHCAWLEATLQASDRRLYVGMLGSVPVGVIRFDRHDDARHEVSLYLDPAYLGLGLGPALLRAGEREMGEGANFAATVLAGNPASSKLFAAAGYREVLAGQWVKDSRPAARTRHEDC